MTVQVDSQIVTDQIMRYIHMGCINNSISCLEKKTTFVNLISCSFMIHFLAGIAALYVPMYVGPLAGPSVRLSIGQQQVSRCALNLLYIIHGSGMYIGVVSKVNVLPIGTSFLFSAPIADANLVIYVSQQLCSLSVVL